MGKTVKAAIFNNSSHGALSGDIFSKVFAQGRDQRLAEITDLYPERINDHNFDKHLDHLQNIEVIFATWGMPRLTNEQVKKLSSLKIVFYAAGATKYFREPFDQNGITVCSATTANAVPVAEFTLAQILLAGAGYFRNSRECVNEEKTHQKNSYRGYGNYGGRVSILGNGTISNILQELLAHHHLDVIVVPSRAENRTLSLEEAFETSFAVVSLFPDRDDNAGVLNGDLFRRMIDGAVFINVGRGRQVSELELIEVMKERPDLTALLDVQYPEPPVDESELYQLANIQLSAHIAGSKGAELIRMADYMIEEFQRYAEGEPLLYEVQTHQL